MAKKQPNIHAQHMAELRRNRAFGGGLAQPIDYIMGQHEQLVAALDGLLTWCHANVAYFASYAAMGEAEANAAEEALAAARGEVRT